MPRAHRPPLAAALAALLLMAMLAGCERRGGQSSTIVTPPSSFPTAPSVLVSSTMQNSLGIAAGYGKLYLVEAVPTHSW
jgi:hypothetical protein